MAHAEQSKDAQRIWAGDKSVTIEALERYRKDPEKGLIPYAVALYSFRMDETYARELLTLREALIAHVGHELQHPDTVFPHHERVADRADVLSTHLEWMARRVELANGERLSTHRAAAAICAHGLKVAAGLPTSHHTWSLLKLTSARLYLSAGDFRRAIGEVVAAGKYAHRIRDPNQRVRVYAKLGLLWRKCHRPRTGVLWGVRALFVRGVPVAVRKKAFAALLGIDR